MTPGVNLGGGGGGGGRRPDSFAVTGVERAAYSRDRFGIDFAAVRVDRIGV